MNLQIRCNTQHSLFPLLTGVKDVAVPWCANLLQYGRHLHIHGARHNLRGWGEKVLKEVCCLE